MRSMIGVPELIFILVIVLILFGPGKLPKIGSALGQGIAEFKKASSKLGPEEDRPSLEGKKDETVDASYPDDKPRS